GVPAGPDAEDDLPDENARAVEPGGMELVEMGAVPAADMVQFVAALKPFGAQHAGDVRIGKPLRPAHGLIGELDEGNAGFAFDGDRGVYRVESGAQAGRGFLGGVEEDDIEAAFFDQRRHLVDGLGGRSGFPGIIGETDFYPAPLE